MSSHSGSPRHSGSSSGQDGTLVKYGGSSPGLGGASSDYDAASSYGAPSDYGGNSCCGGNCCVAQVPGSDEENTDSYIQAINEVLCPVNYHRLGYAWMALEAGVYGESDVGDSDVMNPIYDRAEIIRCVAKSLNKFDQMLLRLEFHHLLNAVFGIVSVQDLLSHKPRIELSMNNHDHCAFEDLEHIIRQVETRYSDVDSSELRAAVHIVRKRLTKMLQLRADAEGVRAIISMRGVGAA